MSEIYHRTISHILKSMQKVETSMNDIMIWGTDSKSHLCTVKKMLDIYKANNLTLNKEKCQIAVTELTFLGDQLTANCLKPDPAKVKPIVEFTTPKEQADVARFLGMVKYLTRYTENLSKRTLHMSNVIFT